MRDRSLLVERFGAGVVAGYDDRAGWSSGRVLAVVKYRSMAY